jgi:CRP/FNR family transcriptional regulator, dissimilatory nitrate respiration regulator
MTSLGIRGLPESLCAVATRAQYKAGQTIFRRGGSVQSVYFVEIGAVRLLRFGRSGEEVILHRAAAGEFFAEASLDSARYHCDAVASEPSALLKVPAAALRRLIESDPHFAREWMALLASRLRAVRLRVECLSLKSAAERIRHLLISEGRGPNCEFTVEGTLKDLARSLGLTHESLYRSLATMERDGVVERDGPTLRLLN